VAAPLPCPSAGQGREGKRRLLVTKVKMNVRTKPNGGTDEISTVQNVEMDRKKRNFLGDHSRWSDLQKK